MNDGTVSIFDGNGDGTFQPAVNVFVGVGIDAIVAGNFNGDGTTDLAVANYDTGTVTILTPEGNDTWSVGTPIAVGANPWYITAGDFRGNSEADIATAGFGSGVSVLLNNGDGTFQSAVNYMPGAYLTGIVAADMNGDGKVDLVVSDYGNNAAGVLLGNGDGTFQSVQEFAAGSGPNGIAVADLLGRGKLDIVVANQNSNSTSVLLNTGLQAVANQPMSDTVASFTDANALATPDQFTATITWGDNTDPDTGTVIADPQGGFDVLGGHTYSAPGIYMVTITITDEGGSTVEVTNTVYVTMM
jgi:hypothetical protein